MSETNRHFFEGLFTDLVEQGRVDRIATYFTPNATINLDGKELSYDDFEKRVSWMAQRKLRVSFVDVLATEHQAFCKHFTEIEENGQISTFRVLSHLLLRDGRITRFEHAASRIDGEAPQSVVNDF